MPAIENPTKKRNVTKTGYDGENANPTVAPKANKNDRNKVFFLPILKNYIMVGQSWCRKIQSIIIGLSADYKDKDSDFGKWPTHFFGYAYLPYNKIEECFVELIADAPSDDKCMKFADYILEFYIDGNSRFPPTIWASPPDPEEKRTTNGAESFHAHLNEQFYIFVFVDVLLKLQTTSYIEMRTLSIKAPVRKYEKEKMNFLVEQYTKLVNGECTTVVFLNYFPGKV
ncbi:unnamed protein product [Mytilus coruscus]|uniref:Uncharacterized protein n=1 Tax=Mytilus coruscus TaxID=42192 RepID=A0A6J8ARJ8_MYTCO|nr:unnamed protein product [Mytilus coruscus]